MRIKLKQVVRQLLQNTQKLQIKWFIRNSVRSFQLTQMATQFQMRQLHNIRMIQTIQTKGGVTPTPVIPGYVTDIPNVTPSNPGADTPVVYRKADQKAVITYVTKQQVKPLPMIKSVVNQVRLSTTQLRTRSSTMKIVVMFSLAMSSQQVPTSITMRQSIKHGQ